MTEYIAPGAGFGQRFLVSVLRRMVAADRARGHDALRSAVEAGQAAPDAPADPASDDDRR